jgi:hypothetical protein
MPDICAWLEANDIPHADVPVDHVPTITGDQIKVRVQKRNARGRFYLEPGTERIASEVRTYPLKRRPPAKLRPWLAGQIPYRTAGDQRRIKAAASRLREATDG